MEPILGGVKAGRMIYPAHLIAPYRRCINGLYLLKKRVIPFEQCLGGVSKFQGGGYAACFNNRRISLCSASASVI